MPDAFATESAPFRQVVCQAESVGLTAAQPLTQFGPENHTQELDGRVYQVKSKSCNKHPCNVHVA